MKTIDKKKILVGLVCATIFSTGLGASGVQAATHNENTTVKGTFAVQNASGVAQFTVAQDGAIAIRNGNDTADLFGVSGSGTITTLAGVDTLLKANAGITTTTLSTSGLLSANGGINADGNFIVANDTGNTTINGTTTLNGVTQVNNTLGVTGTTTLSGLLKANGGINADGNFIVANDTGNTTINGTTTLNGVTKVNNTLGVTGTTTLSGLLKADGGINADNGKFTVADGTGDTTIAGTTTIGTGTTTTIKNDKITLYGGAATSTTTIDGTTFDNGGLTIKENEINAVANLGNVKVEGVTMSQGNINADSATIAGLTINAQGLQGVVNADSVLTPELKVGSATNNTAFSNDAATGLTVTTQGAATGLTIKDDVVNGVTLNKGNVTATKITATTADLGDLKITGNKIDNVSDNAAAVVEGVSLKNGTIGAGEHGTEFTVDAAGAVKGSSFTDGTATLKGGTLSNGTIYSINADGSIKAASGKFNVATDGTTTIGENDNKTTIGNQTVTVAKGTVKTELGTGTGSFYKTATDKTDIDGSIITSTNATGSTTVDGNSIVVSDTAGGNTTEITSDKVKTKDVVADTLTVKSYNVNGRFIVDENGNLFVKGINKTTDEFTINSDDGSFTAANNKFAVDADGAIKAANNRFTVDKDGAVEAANGNVAISKTGVITSGTATNNQTTIDKGTYSSTSSFGNYNNTTNSTADNNTRDLKNGTDENKIIETADGTSTYTKKGTDTTTTETTAKGITNEVTDNVTHQTSTVAQTADGLTASGAGGSYEFNTTKGIGTFTGKDASTTTVNGSKVDLNNGTVASTSLDAGTATFTGLNNKSTKIEGDTITTETLKTNKLVLGNGDTTKIEVSEDGSASFANEAFKIATDGSVTNNIENNSFTTSSTGTNLTYTNPTTNVVSNTSVSDSKTSSTVTNGTTNTVSGSVVTDGQVKNSVGADASSTVTKDSVTDKVADTAVTTKDGSITLQDDVTKNGVSINTNTGETTFTGLSDTFGSGSQKTTVINGNTIKTGQITTDSLVITGKGDAAGASFGTIVLAEDGSIKSHVTDNTNTTTFETKATGTNTDVLDTSNNHTSAKVTATGSRTEVSDDNKNKNNFDITATGTTNTVTDGTTTATNTVAANAITNQVGNTKQVVTSSAVTTTAGSYVTTNDANGIKVTNDGGTTSTQVTSGDVEIKTSVGKDIKLSDLGSIEDLASELRQQQGNTTIVDAINSEGDIRRKEVARLDNRIDDTNTRLDRVGAMSAAIASLKSMGYDPAAPTEFAMGVGHYSGKTALAVGFFHYPNRDFMLNMSYTQSGSENMWGVGATWKFGRRNPDKLLNDQLKDRQARVKLAQEKAAIAAAAARDAEKKAAYAAKVARLAETEAATSVRDTEKAYEAKETYEEAQARKLQKMR